MSEQVLLLHGLGRTRISLRRMTNGVERAGYRCFNLDYPSRAFGLSELVEVVRDRLRAMAAGEGAPMLHGVGHSLGGVLLRALLADPPAPWRAGRLVTIASPHRGARIVGPMLRRASLRLWFGPVLADLAWESHALQALAARGAGTVEVGAIAGAGGFFPLVPAAWVKDRLGVSGSTDGTVEVESACGAPWWPPFEDCLEVRRGHTFVSANAAVIEQTIFFLQHGRFDHEHGARRAPPPDAER